jgi:hypothetical protein
MLQALPNSNQHSMMGVTHQTQQNLFGGQQFASPFHPKSCISLLQFMEMSPLAHSLSVTNLPDEEDSEEELVAEGRLRCFFDPSNPALLSEQETNLDVSCKMDFCTISE